MSNRFVSLPGSAQSKRNAPEEAAMIFALLSKEGIPKGNVLMLAHLLL